jgi:hypothetical protein
LLSQGGKGKESNLDQGKIPLSIWQPFRREKSELKLSKEPKHTSTVSKSQHSVTSPPSKSSLAQMSFQSAKK